MTDRVLLIDADILVFRNAAAEQLEVEWATNLWSYSCDHAAVMSRIDGKLSFWMRELEADRFYLCFSDPEANFRKEVADSYKSHRKGKKPLGYLQLVQQCMDKYPHRILPRLEADDVMGIMATQSKEGVEPVIVTADKDLRTIPAKFCDMLGEPLQIEDIGEFAADRYWMKQTLTGDHVDNYKGCPGVGKVKAKQVLEGCDDLDSMWDKVLAAFENAGLTEEDALTQARLARILRSGDYDKATGEVLLWQPGVAH